MNWSELSSVSLDEIIGWADDQPWARAMAECQQDAEWHAEGDVWTHTKMVCRQLPQLPEWSALDKHSQTILIFTALFHDSAKPLVSFLDPETGHVTSPKHALKGEHLARSVLRDLRCDLATREQIARLVRFHGRPAFLFEKEKPELEVISLSWLVNHRLLYLFALADSRGRKTNSGRAEDSIHYWQLLAEELNCLDQPYRFVHDHARFCFYRNDNPDLFYVPHEQYRCTVTIMSGLPGSGKDTWLSRRDLPTVSLDDIRGELDVDATDNQGEVIQAAKEKCRDYLRKGISFAFNATNLIRQTRKRWVDLCADYNARIEMVYVEPPLDTIIEQNKRRGRNVPEGVIRQLAQKVEPPTLTEVHSLTILD